MNADLFAPITGERELRRNGRTYRLTARSINGEHRVAVSWREPGRSGVLGGFYHSDSDALAQIEYAEQARCAIARIAA